MASPRYFNYEHMNLVPRKCIVDSRAECDTYVQFGPQTFRVPVMPANMECVINEELAERLAEAGYFYVLHRFNVDVAAFSRHMKERDLFVSISVGVNEDSYELLRGLKAANLVPDYVTIDIAHGHAIKMERMIRWIKAEMGPAVPFIIAGNVSTAEAVRDLESWGADAIKVGIGPGCLKNGTRILMADGIYKNIEDVQVGDFVINKDGNPVKVLNVMDQGIQPVFRIKNNLHYTDTYATENHKFFIGDLSTSSDSVLSSSGIAKQLDKMAKTVPKSSKYKWKELEDCDWKNTFALLPKNIHWNLPENFTIDLKDTLVRGTYDDTKIKTNGDIEFNRFVKSDYNLGYIIGMYLGDGTARVDINQVNNTECGRISWFLNQTELAYCEKLSDCIYNSLGIRIKETTPKGKSIYLMTLHNKCLAKVFKPFGKKHNKYLPSSFLCKNKEYIQGLFDGLVNSDGHIERCKENGRPLYNFTNTSIQLMELFEWCCINLGISYTSHLHTTDSGNLKGVSEESVFNQSYRAKTHTMNRFTKDYLYSNILSFDKQPVYEQTWDLEVDCETHSFIANNMIVHNSACTTYNVTGFGSRGAQAAIVKECSDAAKSALIIADGGIKDPGDIAKSLVLGAHMVMVGGMFSGLVDSPGNLVMGADGREYKEFWGSASAHAFGKSGRVEGTKKLIPLTHKTVLDEMKYLEECLQSAISYGGGKSLSTLRQVDYFVRGELR